MPIYALAMETPGRYIVGQSSAAPDAILSTNTVALQDAAHLTVLKEQSILTPIDVLDNFHAKVSSYIGFGVLNEDFSSIYESWLEMHKNPPDFEVQEGE